MNAAAIVELADEDGISAVARELNCTARQAADVTALARKAVAGGHDLRPDQIPYGAVTRSKAMHRVGRVMTDAEVRELAERIDPPEMHSYAAQAAVRLRAVLEQNVGNGYREWEHKLQEMDNAG